MGCVCMCNVCGAGGSGGAGETWLAGNSGPFKISRLHEQLSQHSTSANGLGIVVKCV